MIVVKDRDQRDALSSAQLLDGQSLLLAVIPILAKLAEGLPLAGDAVE